MASSLVRGKYVISRVTGPNSAVVISDGAVLQQDGLIVEVGEYQDLRSRYPNEEVIGSSNYVVMPGRSGLMHCAGHGAGTCSSPVIPDAAQHAMLRCRAGTSSLRFGVERSRVCTASLRAAVRTG